MNGAVSNLAAFPRDGRHRWAASCATAATTSSTCTSRTPRTCPGTRPRRRACRSSPPSTPTRRAALANRFAANFIGARRLYSKLSARIAVSEAARWTAQRYYGGRYRIIPNGVDLSAARPDSSRAARGAADRCSSGAPRSARACPCCCARSRRCAASACLRGSPSPARRAEEVEPLLLDPEGIEIAGHVDDGDKWRLLGEADLLCAPSLGGESFGMVLTEAFASGTPVVASDIAGYRDVVRDGHDGVLVPVGDAVALGETLLELAFGPGAALRDGRGRARARRALRLAARGARGRVTSTRRRSPCPSPRAAWRAPRSASASSPPSPGRASARSACRRSSRRTPPPAGAAAWRARRGGCWWARGAVAGVGLAAARAPADRHRVDRPRHRGRHAGLGARGLRADVRLDARARRGLARDPARRAARHARAPARRRARDDDRRADVRHAAGPARRAVARADRGETGGPRARPLPDRARHARLADAAQPRRAGRARGRDVPHRRPVPGKRGRARGRHARAGGAAGARALGALAPAPRQAEPLPARAAGRGARARRDAARALGPPGLPQAAARLAGRS